jgi:hypothetical protein
MTATQANTKYDVALQALRRRDMLFDRPTELMSTRGR